MKGSIAIGSRRTWPTVPSAAAVCSEPTVAPMNTPCAQSRASVANGRRLAATAEQDRRNRHASRVIPLGATDGHCDSGVQ